MVVAKRAPAPPVVARASSTQRAKGRPTAAAPNGFDTSSLSTDTPGKGNLHDIERVTANGDRLDDSPSKKGSKSKSKSKQRKGSKKGSRTGRGLGDYLFGIFLLWFTIYTVALCPEDIRNERPVCRVLSEYRRLVLDPYVLPPIHMALSHPSVAPYIEKAKPYADRALKTAKPVAHGVVHQWNARVIPQWNHHVAPQWRRHIVPMWYRYAVPKLLQLDTKVAPYRNRVTDEYERRVVPVLRHVSPYVQQAVVATRRLRAKLRPYVIVAAHKTYDGYQYVAPYARPAWEKVKLLVVKTIAFLAEQRRQFVDPHVRKIWERVKELSSGTPNVPPAADVRASVSARVSRAAEGAASVASSLMSSPTHVTDIISQASDAALALKSGVLTESNLVPATVESTSPTSFPEAAVDITPTVTSVASAVANALEDTASSVSAAVSGSAVWVSSAASSLHDSVLPSASEHAASVSGSVVGVAEDLLASGSEVVGSSASIAVDAASTALSHVSDSLLSSSHDAALAVSAEITTSAASGTASAVSSAASSLIARASSSIKPEAPAASIAPDIDLDAFAAELGLDDIVAEISSSAPGTATEASTPSAPVDAETEEQRQKRIQEIAEKRADVEARHSRWEDEQAVLIEDSKRSLRRALVALRKAATAELKESSEIRAEIESFVSRAEDLLKGAEKYLQNLVKEPRPHEEKRQLLERVLTKVQDKFTDRLSETEAVLNGWYAPWLDKELLEVRKVAEVVKSHAENAQVDIGMDYAYMDDTTYQDWQRYHDLVRRSENFTAEAQAMQDGSSTLPPANPLTKELKAIQTEVEDVVLGFETRLRRISRNNARAFGEGTNEDETDGGDETASILPIEDNDKGQSPADVVVPPVVIGRSQEEVMEALDRIVEADGDATSSPQATDKPMNPESEVKSLVETFTEQSIPTISLVASHEEL